MAGKTDDGMINTFITFVCDKLCFFLKTYSLLTSKDNVACFDEDSLYFFISHFVPRISTMEYIVWKI